MSDISQIPNNSSIYDVQTQGTQNSEQCYPPCDDTPNPDPKPSLFENETSNIDTLENASQKNNKLTMEDLAKANKGAFKDVPKFMAEELEKAYSQYGIESGEYDLLDDETGLAQANMEEFETAYALEQLNANIGNGSSAINKEEKYDNVYYSYDTDGDGDFETRVAFDSKSGELVEHHIDDEGVAANITGRGHDFYVESENIAMNYNSEYNELRDKSGQTYNISYDSDGTVKNISIAEQKSYKEECPPLVDVPSDDFPFYDYPLADDTPEPDA